MISSVLRFWSKPEPTKSDSLLDIPDESTGRHYSFLVVSSPWDKVDSGVASVLPLTTESAGVAGIHPHHLVLSGGEGAAHKKAIDSLKSNSVLSELLFFEQANS